MKLDGQQEVDDRWITRLVYLSDIFYFSGKG